MGKKQGDTFLVIGVTGGIGSGKTTVSTILQEAGAIVIDADRLSRAATERGTTVYAKIVDAFGTGYLNEDGTINRNALAEKIFTDASKRKILEGLIHAQVVEDIDNMLAECRSEAYKGVLVLDVPIPVKRGFLDVCDEVWVVECSDSERIKRALNRGGMSEDQVRVRIKAQQEGKYWDSIASRIICNEGDLEALKLSVLDCLALATLAG